MTKKRSAGMKLLSVILGALMCGFMWRCRGSTGWGTSWGLYGVGLVLMLLIFHFYSDRKNMKFEMIPLGSVLMGLGVTGYATVIDQTGGVLWSDLPYSGELLNGQSPVLATPDGDVYVPIEPVSGMIIFFIMAFTLVPLVAFFVTSLFSDKKYEFKDYVILSVIFFAASLVFKATAAHPILKAINPEQVQYAALGLKAYGHDYASPMAAYMSHFQNRRWTQEIPFFENYYMSIEHISDAFAIFVTTAYIRFVRKDKYTAFGSLLIDLLTAVASTVFSPLVSAFYHAGFFKDTAFPTWFIKIADWGVWEFSTGFFFGLFVMLFLAITAGRHTNRTDYDDAPLFVNKKVSFGFNLLASVWVFCVAPARMIGFRLAGLLEYLEVLPDDDPFDVIFSIVIAVVLIPFIIKILRRNILEKGTNAVDMLPATFARKALPIYLVVCFFAYFFLDNMDILSLRTDITVPMMLITSALIAILYIPVRQKLKHSCRVYL